MRPERFFGGIRGLFRAVDGPYSHFLGFITLIDDHCEVETAKAPMKFGNIVSAAAEFLEDLAEGFAGLFGGNARSYVDLETAVGSNILVSNDGAMMSLLRMNGSTRMVGEAEFLDIVSGLSVALSSSMKKKGHVIQVSFSNDGAGESLQVALNGQFSGMKRAADKLDLALDDVLADRRKIVHKTARWKCARSRFGQPGRLSLRPNGRMKERKNWRRSRVNWSGKTHKVRALSRGSLLTLM